MMKPYILHGFKCGLAIGLVAILGSSTDVRAENDDNTEQVEENTDTEGPGDTVQGARRKSYIVPDRAPRPGQKLIDNKLHSTAGRFELTAFYDTSLNDKYVKHQGGHGALLYHLSDWLALEVFGGSMVGKESQILSKVRTSGNSFAQTRKGQCGWNPVGGCEPNCLTSTQTTWFAGGAIQWAPFYGKAVSGIGIRSQLPAVLNTWRRH